MSLDVTLYEDPTESFSQWEKRKAESLKEAGDMKGLIPLIEEYYEDRKPFDERKVLYDANITHNLGNMAMEAGIYEHLWHPDSIGISKAKDLIDPITKGLADMKARPEHYEKFNASNGWGLYEHFIPWIERYLEALNEYPNAIVKTDT